MVDDRDREDCYRCRFCGTHLDWALGGSFIECKTCPWAQSTPGFLADEKKRKAKEAQP